MINGKPCKVTDTITSKPGKHGCAKVMLKGIDIETGKDYECTFKAGDIVDTPIEDKV